MARRSLSAHSRALPTTAARHPYERLCARCNQWRVRSQFPRGAQVCGACREVAPSHLEVLIDEVEWLLGTDTPDGIARRLGLRHAAALKARLAAAGRSDLVRALAVRSVR